MLAAMTVQRESFRRKKRAEVTKKEQCCSQKEQSEMWGIIRKRAAENRPRLPNAVRLRLRRNQNYYFLLRVASQNN